MYKYIIEYLDYANPYTHLQDYPNVARPDLIHHGLII